jgi:hypothetical protein
VRGLGVLMLSKSVRLAASASGRGLARHYDADRLRKARLLAVRSAEVQVAFSWYGVRKENQEGRPGDQANSPDARKNEKARLPGLKPV